MNSRLAGSVPDHDRTDPFNLDSGSAAASGTVSRSAGWGWGGVGVGGRLRLLGVRSEREQEVVMLAGAKLHICD